MSNKEEKDFSQLIDLKKSSVKDWMVLSATTLGVVLTILALIWGDPPSKGVLTASMFLMLSFILFFNSITASSRTKAEIYKERPDKQMIKNLMRWSEHSFGLGLTFVIVAIAILSYKYMIDFLGQSLFALILPIIFILTALICMSIYTKITRNGKSKPIFRVRFKKLIWSMLELASLVLISLDYFGLITIL